MMQENLAIFMNLAEFATTVTLNGVTVAAIFDEAYAGGDVGPFGMASTAPQLTIATADVPAAVVGMPVVANGTNYTVAAHEPDGTGVSRLVLELA
jgi:hypothetical protein